MPAIHHQRNVDIDDIAITQRLVIGDAVAHDMVDRGANTPRKTAIIQRRGVGVVVHREFECYAVQIIRRHTGLDQIDHQIERFRGQFASLAHGRKRVLAKQLDLACTALGGIGRFDEGHRARFGARNGWFRCGGIARHLQAFHQSMWASRISRCMAGNARLSVGLARP